MINLLKRYVIGGRSGKRESGWLLVILWCLAAIGVVIAALLGRDVAMAVDMLKFTFYPIIAFLAGAYGLEWASTQSKWKAEPHVDFSLQE